MSVKKMMILIVACAAVFLLFPCQLSAGVSKEIESQYKLQYENKALFLKIPIRGEAETLMVRGDRTRLNPSGDISGLRFRVGEQVRITSVDFKDSQVEFKVSAIDQSKQGLLIFQFRQSLAYSFPEKQDFEKALNVTFTEGLSYQQIDEAKEDFIVNQFEEQVREFVAMAGVTPDFVMKSVAKKNPQFESIQNQLNQTTSELESLKAKLASEQEMNRSSSEELRDLRAEILALKNANDSMLREKENLTGNQQSLQREITNLRTQNQNYQRQLEEIAGKLNIESDSKSQLGKQVNNLSQRVETLNQERDNLASQVKGLKSDLATSERESEKLSRDLQTAERTAGKLRSDLNALTSNKNSLESTFIRTKNEKESLELAGKLEEALTVKPRDEETKGGRLRISEIWLRDHKIGQIEIRVPNEAGQDLVAKLQVDSPDTVQFDEETRNLYQSIGEKFRLKAGWNAWTDDLVIQLKEGEEVQSAGTRETTQWMWETSSESDSAKQLSFVAHIINEDDHPVLLCRQDFEIASSGLISGITTSFSISSLLIGVLIGFVGVGILVAARSNKSNGKVQQRRPLNKQVRKEL